jgi:uncharacterized protein (TIGR03067 family)
VRESKRGVGGWVRVGLAGAVALLATTAARPQDDKGLSPKAKAELAKLEGKWRVVKGANAREEGDVPDAQAFVLTFKGAEATMALGDKAESVLVTALDPTTDPKCIDLGEKRKGRDPRTLEGVYRIDGDTLRLAFAVPRDGKLRPTSFEKPTDPRVTVWTFKKVKE